MLDRVPLRATRWVMAHRHRQSEPIANSDLQSLFPGADLTTVAAASVTQQQEVVNSGEAHLAFSSSPGGDRRANERGRVARGANAVRDGSAEYIVRVVMHVDRHWLASQAWLA